MTALLEFKQKIKGIYAQYEMYLLPLLKFVLALVYFIWINTNMGYMTALDNIFVVLILSLICCILPSGMMIFAGFALMVGHCYALGIEVAAFLLVLILFMMILFLRFSSGKNIVLVFTPLAFAFDIPVLLPIGCGLLSSAVSALPAAGGVIIYYFVRTVRIQSQALLGMDSDIVGKLTLLSDSLMKNGEMWLTLIAFIVVVLAVNLIRTRMFDYAWRIAIVAGGVIYIVIMLAGSMSLGISISVFSLIIYTVVAVLVGIILEFFVFGGDYTRTERLEYEDDDYYYYVKAVPKALVATSERSIKKINGESAREERKSAERVVNYSTPLFQGEEPPKKKKRVQETEAASVVQKADIDDIDTLVFDEIDTGISGIAAQIVGEKLSDIAKKKQIICITHLPQIAANADTHYCIEKDTSNNRTFTNVSKLNESQRKNEIARLIAGNNITEKTIEHASEIIELAKKC